MAVESIQHLFPPPPHYYQNYTNDNLSDPSLNPPPPLTTSHNLFGVTYTPKFIPPTLESSGFKNLINANDEDPLPVQIRSLILTATFSYARYLHQLYNDCSNDDSSKVHVQNIQDLLVNAVHLIGTYRTDQALRSLRIMLMKMLYDADSTHGTIDHAVASSVRLLQELVNEPSWS